ncbi:MAG: hypothetical protein ACI9RO_001625 [Alteromonas macleodii]|jgi:hypothetical protein
MLMRVLFCLEQDLTKECRRLTVVDALQDSDLIEIGLLAKGLTLITGGSVAALGLERNLELWRRQQAHGTVRWASVLFSQANVPLQRVRRLHTTKFISQHSKLLRKCCLRGGLLPLQQQTGC